MLLPTCHMPDRPVCISFIICTLRRLNGVGSCWNTLGLAIRMGQSIGLHVEASSTGSTQETSMECRSQQRRTWYSMYVLDRLLALQLGRPMAIHEGDSHVELPSLQDQSAFAMDTNEHTLDDTHVSSMMAYFRAVICFSSIVSQVICELYRPSQIDLRPDQMLHSASSLDQQLAQWKESLARHLRFDRGHTFEKSISFKRQVRSVYHIVGLSFYFVDSLKTEELLAQHARCEVSPPSSSHISSLFVPTFAPGS